jgi:pimeloyl-ACP methyl ester carboxylesterase
MKAEMSSHQYFTLPDGRRIAHRHNQGKGPLIAFLPGYMSDMDGGKATTLLEAARAKDHACLLLDYSGCGKSDGDFANGTLSAWRDEALALIDHVTDGPVILVGSSMGGWLMLMVGMTLGDRLAGMVGIAAAPDFSDWGCSDEQKESLACGKTIFEDNPYGPEPTPTHAQFWQDAQDQLLLGGEIAIDCPIRLLHGQRDADVPWQISMQLAERLRSENIQLALIKDGDHRLSRDEDIALLIRQVWSLIE